MYKAVGVRENFYTLWGVVDLDTEEVKVQFDYYAPQARQIADWLNEHPEHTELDLERALVAARPSDKKFYTDSSYAEWMVDSPLMAEIVEQRKQRDADVGVAFCFCVMILATLGAALRFVVVHWR